MNILIIGRFPESAQRQILRCFPADWRVRTAEPEQAAEFLSEADAVIPEHIRVDAAFLSRAPKLCFVQTGAGYDNVDLDACTARGVRVCCAAGVNADAVAEHVLALILCRYKNICLLDRFMKAGGDERMLDYAGAELSGKTVGILGLGAVGQRVAALCTAFGMRVLGFSRRPVSLPGVIPVDLERLYAESDVVTVHLPLTDETRHLIGREAFARMKTDALFVNTARGAIVSEGDLIEALETRQIGGACLDVFEEEPLPADSPLRRLPNVILTPHTAGLPDGVKFHAKRYTFFARNIEKALSGREPEHALN